MLKKSRGLIFLILALLVVITGPGRVENNQELPAENQEELSSQDNRFRAVSGVLDLAGWDFTADGMVNLAGEWEFYWQELLEPADFINEADITGRAGLLQVPGGWNGYEAAGEIITGKGFATYRLIIKNMEQDQVLGLRLPGVMTAYRFWLDEALMIESGRVAGSAAEGVPQYKPEVTFFYPEKDTVQLLVQVSNYHHNQGGLNTVFSLGSSEQIHEARTSRTNTDLFLFGCFLILGFYNLGFYIFNRKDLSTLYFFLFCVLIVLRISSTGEIMLLDYFPALPWSLRLKISYISMAMGGAMLVLFFRELYPEDVRKQTARIVSGISAVYSFFVIFTPALIYTLTTPLLQLITVVQVIYIIAVVVRICFIKKREGTMLFMAGFFVVFVSIIIEILNHFYITAVSILNFGFIFLVFTMSMVISTSFIRAYIAVESMSEKLKEYGETMAEKVRSRTRQLQDILDDLRFSIVNETNVAISNLSNSSQELANIASDALGRAEEMKGGLSDAGKCETMVSERVKEGVSAINSLAQETADTKDAAHSMRVVAKNLTTIIEGIKNMNEGIRKISDKIEILSQNAAIEAARAGDYGSGFSVVANQIRELSGNAYRLVEDIEEQAVESSNKLHELKYCVFSVRAGISRTEETVTVTNIIYHNILQGMHDLTETLQELGDKIIKVTGDSESNAAISEEQAATAEEISSQIASLTEMVESLEDD